MKILLFGIARDIVGGETLNVELIGDATVGILKNHIKQKYPSFDNLNSFMIAVNQKYADDQKAIGPTDEIAVIPPVSGG